MAIGAFVVMLAFCDLIEATARDTRSQQQTRHAIEEMKAAQRLAEAIGEKCKELERTLADCKRGAK